MFRNTRSSNSFGRADTAFKREIVLWEEIGKRVVFLRFLCWLRSLVSFFMLVLAF